MKQKNLVSYNLEQDEERPLIEFTTLLKIIIVAFSFLIAFSLLFLPLPISVGMFIGIICLLLISINPYWGLLVVIASSFIQPTSFFPQLYPFHIVRVLSITTFLCWILNVLVKGNFKLVKTRQNIFILIFCFFVFISALQHPYYSLSLFLESLKFFILYFLILNLVDDEKSLNTFIKCMGFVGIIMAAIGIWQYMHGIGIVYVYEGIVRITGTLDDPNDFALHLIVILPLLVYLYRTNSHIWIKTMAVIGFPLLILAVIFTFSRGGFFGLALSIFLIIKQFVLQKRVKQWLYFALFLLILIIAIPQIPRSYWQRLQPEYIFSDPAVVSRLQAWQTGWEMIKDKPFTGIGLGTFQYFYLPYAPAGVDPLRKIVAHNMFVSVGAETGLPALSAFLIIIIYSFLNLFRAKLLFKKSGQESLLLLSDAITISLIGYCACSMFLSVEWLSALWITIGLAVIIRKRAEGFNPI